MDLVLPDSLFDRERTLFVIARETDDRTTDGGIQAPGAGA